MFCVSNAIWAFHGWLWFFPYFKKSFDAVWCCAFFVLTKSKNNKQTNKYWPGQVLLWLFGNLSWRSLRCVCGLKLLGLTEVSTNTAGEWERNQGEFYTHLFPWHKSWQGHSPPLCVNGSQRICKQFFLISLPDLLEVVWLPKRA